MFHKKDKAFAIYSGECGSSFVLFDRVFRSLSMTYIRGSINQGRETFSEHSRDGQCTFVSLEALLFLAESRFTLFTGELWHFFVSLIPFADLL